VIELVQSSPFVAVCSSEVIIANPEAVSFEVSSSKSALDAKG